MAEIGIIASVLQVAGAGLKLSETLYRYADAVASADRRIKDIAKEVQLTSLVINELGKVFGQHETSTLMSENAVKTADETVKECSVVFAELDDALRKSKKGTWGKLMLPFRESKIELLRSHIDKLKSTLNLLMQVLMHAHLIASQKLDRKAEVEQRQHIRILLQNKKESTKRYEESLKNYSMSSEETIIGDRSLDFGQQEEADMAVFATSIASTINTHSLKTCVEHIQTLMEDLDKLRKAIDDQEDDSSEHQQSLIGSYFRARSHLDTVLLGSSKASAEHANPKTSAAPSNLNAKSEGLSTKIQRSLTGSTLVSVETQPTHSWRDIVRGSVETTEPVLNWSAAAFREAILEAQQEARREAREAITKEAKFKGQYEGEARVVHKEAERSALYLKRQKEERARYTEEFTKKNAETRTSTQPDDDLVGKELDGFRKGGEGQQQDVDDNGDWVVSVEKKKEGRKDKRKGVENGSNDEGIVSESTPAQAEDTAKTQEAEEEQANAKKRVEADESMKELSEGRKMTSRQIPSHLDQTSSIDLGAVQNQQASVRAAPRAPPKIQMPPLSREDITKASALTAGVRAAPRAPLKEPTPPLSQEDKTTSSALGAGGPSDWEHIGMDDDEIDDEGRFAKKDEPPWSEDDLLSREEEIRATEESVLELNEAFRDGARRPATQSQIMEIENNITKVFREPESSEKLPIKFKDAVGRRFTFPWHLCQTWQGMDNLITQAFVPIDDLCNPVKDGLYDLIGPGGNIISPENWDTTVKPGWSISMTMWEVADDSPIQNDAQLMIMPSPMISEARPKQTTQPQVRFEIDRAETSPQERLEKLYAERKRRKTEEVERVQRRRQKSRERIRSDFEASQSNSGDSKELVRISTKDKSKREKKPSQKTHSRLAEGLGIIDQFTSSGLSIKADTIDVLETALRPMYTVDEMANYSLVISFVNPSNPGKVVRKALAPSDQPLVLFKKLLEEGGKPKLIYEAKGGYKSFVHGSKSSDDAADDMTASWESGNSSRTEDRSRKKKRSTHHRSRTLSESETQEDGISSRIESDDYEMSPVRRERTGRGVKQLGPSSPGYTPTSGNLGTGVQHWKPSSPAYNPTSIDSETGVQYPDKDRVASMAPNKRRLPPGEACMSKTTGGIFGDKDTPSSETNHMTNDQETSRETGRIEYLQRLNDAEEELRFVSGIVNSMQQGSEEWKQLTARQTEVRLKVTRLRSDTLLHSASQSNTTKGNENFQGKPHRGAELNNDQLVRFQPDRLRSPPGDPHRVSTFPVDNDASDEEFEALKGLMALKMADQQDTVSLTGSTSSYTPVPTTPDMSAEERRRLIMERKSKTKQHQHRLENAHIEADDRHQLRHPVRISPSQTLRLENRARESRSPKSSVGFERPVRQSLSATSPPREPFDTASVTGSIAASDGGVRLDARSKERGIKVAMVQSGTRHEREHERTEVRRNPHRSAISSDLRSRMKDEPKAVEPTLNKETKQVRQPKIVEKEKEVELYSATKSTESETTEVVEISDDGRKQGRPRHHEEEDDCSWGVSSELCLERRSEHGKGKRINQRDNPSEDHFTTSHNAGNVITSPLKYTDGRTKTRGSAYDSRIRTNLPVVVVETRPLPRKHTDGDSPAPRATIGSAHRGGNNSSQKIHAEQRRQETITKTAFPTRISELPIVVRVMEIIAEEADVDPAELVDDMAFEDLGVDSLMSLTISAKFHEDLGLEINPTLFIDYPTVGEMQEFFAEYDDERFTYDEEEATRIPVGELLPRQADKSGIRSPQDIMRDRRDRDARRAAMEQRNSEGKTEWGGERRLDQRQTIQSGAALRVSKPPQQAEKSGIRTPQDVMRDRRERELRRAVEQQRNFEGEINWDGERRRYVGQSTQSGAAFPVATSPTPIAQEGDGGQTEDREVDDLLREWTTL